MTIINYFRLSIQRCGWALFVTYQTPPHWGVSTEGQYIQAKSWHPAQNGCLNPLKSSAACCKAQNHYWISTHCSISKVLLEIVAGKLWRIGRRKAKGKSGPFQHFKHSSMDNELHTYHVHITIRSSVRTHLVLLCIAPRDTWSGSRIDWHDFDTFSKHHH